MITVHLPAALRRLAPAATVTVDAPVATVGELLAALGRQYPDLGRALEDPLYNVAVNERLLLHGVAAHPLQDGDVVDVVPTIAGGAGRVDWRMEAEASASATLRRRGAVSDGAGA